MDLIKSAEKARTEYLKDLDRYCQFLGTKTFTEAPASGQGNAYAIGRAEQLDDQMKESLKEYSVSVNQLLCRALTEAAICKAIWGAFEDSGDDREMFNKVCKLVDMAEAFPHRYLDSVRILDVPPKTEGSQ